MPLIIFGLAEMKKYHKFMVISLFVFHSDEIITWKPWFCLINHQAVAAGQTLEINKSVLFIKCSVLRLWLAKVQVYVLFRIYIHFDWLFLLRFLNLIPARPLFLLLIHDSSHFTQTLLHPLHLFSRSVYPPPSLLAPLSFLFQPFYLYP